MSHAPPVTREWPAPSPTTPRADWPVVAMAGVVVAVGFLVILAILGFGQAVPVCLAVLLAIFLVLLFASGKERCDDVLLEGIRALGAGEDARGVAERLRGLDLGGRAGTCLGVAVRCLEEAGRHGRLEGRLRREAGRWLKETIKEMK